MSLRRSTVLKAVFAQSRVSALRNLMLLISSMAALFALQPGSPIRNAQWLLPALSLLLTIAVWWMAYRLPLNARVFWLSRCLTLLLILLLFALKYEPVTRLLSADIRALNGQNTLSAAAGDLSWLGFSYIAFRLIAVLRDKVQGRLQPASLREFVTFAVFAPALIAGPIDRAEHFARDLRAPWKPNWDDLAAGMQRALIGAVKKFVIADALALLALNEQNAMHTRGAGWMWLLVIAYALRIFFDFAGYTDLALGVARVFGIKLPENFANPYFKPNLTQFWSSWHISLSQFFRSYWFNPLLRALRARNWPIWAQVLLCQSSTMLLIGLWHGVTINFVVWGAWHALGLFVHNRFADWRKTHAKPEVELPANPIAHSVSMALTFVFVALGWVFFALPAPHHALRVFRVMFGGDA